MLHCIPNWLALYETVDKPVEYWEQCENGDYKLKILNGYTRQVDSDTTLLATPKSSMFAMYSQILATLRDFEPSD